MATLLSGLRALDLTDETGYFCGQMLAKLGVEVIKVERPGGDPGRLIGPFYEDVPDKEKSINWFAANANKKGITLNIEDEKGQELFKRLVKGADFLLESFSPGYLDSLGLGYAELSRINPGLIMTSITPFGSEGPYKDYESSDLITMALSGVMSLIGTMEGPPSRIAGDVTYFVAGGYAALGTLGAYHHRELSGEGQQVTTSLLESLMQHYWVTPWVWENDKVLRLRGDYFRDADGNISQEGGFPRLWQCKDGKVWFSLTFAGARRLLSPNALIQWMIEDGMEVGELAEINWEEFDPAMMTPERTQNWFGIISRFFARRTRQELFEEGMVRDVRVGPVLDVPEVLKNEQLETRGFWQEVEHPELRQKVFYPTHLFLASETENQSPKPAPHVGEHNEWLYGHELGLSAQEMTSLKEAGII